MQFSTFYTLGLYLGFQYAHTPFLSGSSNASNLSPARVPDNSRLARRLADDAEVVPVNPVLIKFRLLEPRPDYASLIRRIQGG